MELASSDAMAARFALPVSEFSFFSSPGAAILFFLKEEKEKNGGAKMRIGNARQTIPQSA